MLMEMVEAQGGEAIEEGKGWQNDCQTLAKKMLYHLLAIRTLKAMAKVQVSTINHEYVDYGSIVVLTRAVLENCVVFRFIYTHPDEEVRRFRHMTWKYAGLQDRQKRQATTAFALAKKVEELPICERLAREIKEHVHFQTLSRGAQKALMAKGDWKLGDTLADLAAASGFGWRYFTQVYTYLCDYAHSSYASALQVGQADVEDQSTLTTSILGVSNLCMAKFADGYADVFAKPREVLASSKVVGICGKWNLSAEAFRLMYANAPGTEP